jgi:UDP-sulfoquinovose synthase
MKVLITGIDGYSGWPLALHLLQRGHDVVGLDNFVTRRRVREVGSWSATPIAPFPRRQKAVEQLFGKKLGFHKGDLGRYAFVEHVLSTEKPEVIVHLAEQRSAPYSMIDVQHAVDTQVQNVTGTLHLLYAMRAQVPEAHLVKMGTMGEYGTPNLDIAEGFFEVEYHGRKDRVPFPRQGGSWYHWSKVFDSGDVMFASKIWGLRATDVMQGVIYGTRTPEITDDRLLTRFDFDEIWGTALNRFCVESVLGLPITPYGQGGQIRGFLALEDSVQSLRIAVENPPAAGEYRVWNQFDEAYSVNQLAELTHEVATELGMHPTIEHPPAHGYQRTRELREVLREIFADLKRFRRRLEAKRSMVMPATNWRVVDNRTSIEERSHASAATPGEPGPPTPPAPAGS